MKRYSVILVSLVLIMGLLLGACGESSPAPTSQAPAPTSTQIQSTPVASASSPTTTAPVSTNTITLKFSFDMPKTGAIVPGWEWFASELQTRSNGRVKVDFYPAAALFTQKDTPDSLKAGVADIANVSLASHAQLFPVNNIFAVPGLEFPDGTRQNYMDKYDAYNQIAQKYPAISKELSEYKLLFWCSNPGYRIISKKLITVPSDLKGLKLGGSAMQGKVTQLNGGVWVQAVPNNAYEGINKGVYDGQYVSWAQVAVYKLEEVATYFLDYGFTQETQQVCMNLNTWNSLPTDIQKLIMDLAPETVGRCADGLIATGNKGIENAKSRNRTITTLTAEQIALWDASVAPIADEWLSNMQSKGITSAPDILKDIKALRAEAMK